jgi:hypothetical protein
MEVDLRLAMQVAVQTAPAVTPVVVLVTQLQRVYPTQLHRKPWM